MPFNIWRLPRLLRFYKTKLDNHQDVHKILIPTKNSISKQNFPMTNKKFHVQQNFPCQKILQWPTKICPCLTQKKYSCLTHKKKKKNPHHHKFFFLIPMSIKVSILTKQDLHIPVGKYRPRLIELISFNLKLLIRFIMNKPY